MLAINVLFAAYILATVSLFATYKKQKEYFFLLCFNLSFWLYFNMINLAMQGDLSLFFAGFSFLPALLLKRTISILQDNYKDTTNYLKLSIVTINFAAFSQILLGQVMRDLHIEAQLSGLLAGFGFVGIFPVFLSKLAQSKIEKPIKAQTGLAIFFLFLAVVIFPSFVSQVRNEIVLALLLLFLVFGLSSLSFLIFARLAFLEISFLGKQKEDEIYKKEKIANSMHCLLNSIKIGVYCLDKNLSLDLTFSSSRQIFYGKKTEHAPLISAKDDIFIHIFNGAIGGKELELRSRAILLACIGEDKHKFIRSAEALPQVIRKSVNSEYLLFSLQWLPLCISNSEQISGYLLIAEDITATDMAIRAAQLQREELLIFQEAIDLSAHQLHEFLSVAERIFANVQKIVEIAPGLEVAMFDIIVEHIDIIKNYSHILGLNLLGEAVRQSEERWIKAKHVVGKHHKKEILYDLSLLRLFLKRYELTIRAISTKYLFIKNKNYENFISDIKGLVRNAGGDEHRLLEQIKKKFSSVNSVTIYDLIFPFIENNAKVARKLDKENSHLRITGGDIGIDFANSKIIGVVILKCLWNSVLCSQETRSVRLELGKTSYANIDIAVCQVDARLVIVIQDDSRGMNAARFANISQAGQIVATNEILEIIFLSAKDYSYLNLEIDEKFYIQNILAYAQTCGGDAKINLRGEAQDGYQKFEWVLSFPLIVLGGS